jgi:hypothetical protein
MYKAQLFISCFDKFELSVEIEVKEILPVVVHNVVFNPAGKSRQVRFEFKYQDFKGTLIYHEIKKKRVRFDVKGSSERDRIGRRSSGAPERHSSRVDDKGGQSCW